MPMNPLRADPSLTSDIRRRFQANVNSRFDELNKAIEEIVIDKNWFGLPEDDETVDNTRWVAETTRAKIALFNAWIQTKFTNIVLNNLSRQTIRKAFWYKYIQEGYRKGVGRVFDDMKKPLAALSKVKQEVYEGSKKTFLESAFKRPVGIRRVKQMASRTLTDLKNVNDAMAVKMRQTLTEGLVQGKSPRVVARELTKAVDSIGRQRSLMIARTETVRAHAEGQLDAMEDMGIKEVGVAVEWSTAGDDRVCPLCAELNGIVMKIEEARGSLPRHPNCRCAYIPANVGEDKTNQKRSQKAVQDAIDRSIKREIPKSKQGKRSVEQQRKLTKWAGADTKIDKNRPKPII